MKRKNTAALLEKLESCNSRLYTFIEKADRIQSETPASRIKIKFAAPLDQIRESASRAHAALFRSWCVAHSSHQAGLRLEERLVRRRGGGKKGSPEGDPERTQFGISVLRIPRLCWVDTEFHVENPELQAPRCVSLCHLLLFTLTHMILKGSRDTLCYLLPPRGQQIHDCITTTRSQQHMLGY